MEIRSRIAAVVVLAAGLGLAACGDDDDPATTDTESPSTTEMTEPTDMTESADMGGAPGLDMTEPTDMTDDLTTTTGG